MNYFLKGLISGNRKYWLGVAFIGVWTVALIDAFGTAFGSSGILNGRWFQVTLVLTILAPVACFVYSKIVTTKKQKTLNALEEESALFELEREQEIKDILEENQGFLTLCYECIHFNPDLRHCSRLLYDDVSYQRVKEVKINDRKYCLYWEASYNDQNYD